MVVVVGKTVAWLLTVGVAALVTRLLWYIFGQPMSPEELQMADDYKAMQRRGAVGSR